MTDMLVIHGQMTAKQLSILQALQAFVHVLCPTRMQLTSIPAPPPHDHTSWTAACRHVKPSAGCISSAADRLGLCLHNCSSCS